MKYISRHIKIIILICLGILLALGLYFFLPKKPTFQVENTIPNDQAENVPTLPMLTIHFNKEIPLQAQKNILVHISPFSSFTSTWSPDYQTLTLTPSTELETSTVYSIEITYDHTSLKKFAFTTSKYSQKDVREQKDKQTLDDRSFANTFNAGLSQYPWYTELPLITAQYQIFFNVDTKQFVIGVKQEDKDTNLAQAISAIEKLIGRKLNKNEYTVSPLN